MDKIVLYKNDKGDILQATEFEPVDRDDLVERIEYTKRTLRKLQAALDSYDKLANAAPGTDSEEKTTLHGVVDEDGSHVTFIKKPEATEQPLTPAVPIHPIII